MANTDFDLLIGFLFAIVLFTVVILRFRERWIRRPPCPRCGERMTWCGRRGGADMDVSAQRAERILLDNYGIRWYSPSDLNAYRFD